VDRPQLLHAGDAVRHRGAAGVLRDEAHKGLPWQAENEFRHVGKVEGGEVWEQTVRLENEDGSILVARRIKIALEQATRDGEEELFILTNLPCAEIDALTVARLYRKRWTIETMFQELA